MRLTGGTLGSRKVATPRGRAVRPTPSRVKESLFAILGSRVEGARVLDLFAGSGALGFEALSRGAAHATFVEASRATAEAIRETARALGVAAATLVIAAPVERALRQLGGPYDVIFADPPYADGFPLEALRELRARGLVAPAASVVCEHSSRTPAPPVEGYALERAERYGEVALAILRPAATAHDAT